MNTTIILKWALVAGIVVVLNFFFNYSIFLVYKAPQREKFCPQEQVNIMPTTQEECVAKGGSWNVGGEVPAKPVPTAAQLERATWCDVTFTCQKEFNEAQKLYNRNVFVSLVVLGAISLIVSFFISHLTAVSLGLSLGGVLSLIVGPVRYWNDMDDYLRVIVLGIALVALIWRGVKKIKE